MVKEASKGFGIAGFVLGLLSVLGFFVFFLSLPMAILGLIFSILQLRNNKTGLAIAGLVLSIVGIIASGFITAVFLIGISILGDLGEAGKTILATEKSIVLIKTNVDYISNEGVSIKGVGGGSGVIYLESGGKTYILTNRHVIDCKYIYDCQRISNQTIRVMMFDGKMYNVLNTYIAPNKVDIAILEIAKPSEGNYTVPKIGNPSKNSGKVFAIGYPSFSVNAREYSKEIGRITGFRELITEDGVSFKVIDSDAFITFGSSGGGLFDSEGRLLGITTWGSRENSYAISLESIKPKEDFQTCGLHSYYTDEGCTPYCSGAITDDLKCTMPCTGFYCNMTKIIADENRCRDPSQVLGEDGLCHNACESKETYCGGQRDYCFSNICTSCPLGYRLYDDGMCR
jgi:hypothetical protein